MLSPMSGMVRLRNFSINVSMAICATGDGKERIYIYIYTWLKKFGFQVLVPLRARTVLTVSGAGQGVLNSDVRNVQIMFKSKLSIGVEKEHVQRILKKIHVQKNVRKNMFRQSPLTIT